MMKYEKWMMRFVWAVGVLALAALIFLLVGLFVSPDSPTGPVRYESETESTVAELPEKESGKGQPDSETGESEPDGSMQMERETDPGREENPEREKADVTAGKQPDRETEKPQSEKPPALFLATDLHYQAPEMTDFGTALDAYTKGNDGNIVPYLEAITDAFLEEVTAARPSALILSGDISQNGERKNHEELALRLSRVKEAGIPVLVLPGNHDINHPWSASYYNDRTERVPGVNAQEFYEIYRDFGYDQAISRDGASLSYVYQLDDRYRIMMLDSCIYEPVHKTGGRIRPETLQWMEEQLEAAKAAGATVIPVAHHNLLGESKLYPEDCTLENGAQVTELLERYRVPVFLSGHLHLQRIKKHTAGPMSEGEYGIYEIVPSPLTMSPCQYSVLEWQEDGSLSYHAQKLDMEGWARRYGEEDENLLHFTEYADEFLVKTVADQVFLGMDDIREEKKWEMAELYGRLNRDYCSGTYIDVRAVKRSEPYLHWKRYQKSSLWAARLNCILQDAGRSHTELTIPAEEFKDRNQEEMIQDGI